MNASSFTRSALGFACALGLALPASAQEATLSELLAGTHVHGLLAFVLGEGLVAAQESALDWVAAGEWTEDGVPRHLARHTVDPDRIVVATTDGRLLLSATGGATWTLVAGPGA